MKLDCVIGNVSGLNEKTKKEIIKKSNEVCEKPENVHLFDGMTKNDEKVLVDFFGD